MAANITARLGPSSFIYSFHLSIHLQLPTPYSEFDKNGGIYAFSSFTHATDSSRHYALPCGMSAVSAAEVLVPALEASRLEHFKFRPEGTASVHAVSEAVLYGWI